jgi:hypothetical protein
VPLRLPETSSVYSSFSKLVDALMEDTQGKRTSTDRALLKRHWELILLNLGRCIFLQQWTLVCLSKNVYSNDPWLKKYDLGYRQTKLIVDYMEANDFVKKLKGKKYTEHPVRTRLFPTPEIQPVLMRFFFDAEQQKWTP